jgi:glucose/mannose-6-phosphate isomerase
MNFSLLEKYDSSHMYEIYDLWPQLAKIAYESKQDVLILDDIDHVVLAGMGGSGTVCEVLSAILSKTSIHTTVVKGYHLPKTVNKKTLVIIVSVSGNTSEVISILKLASKKSCNIVSFTSGGRLAEICAQFKISHYLIPTQHSPRASFVSFLYSILNILNKIFPINKSDIYQSLNELENLKKNIYSKNLTRSNLSLSLAKQLTGIPIIYYPWGLQSAAIRFKNSLNENAKIHAISEDIVEASHNGIVAWERKSDTIPIIIRGTDDFEKTKNLQFHLENFFKEHLIDYHVIDSKSGSILTKLVCLIYLFDYSSIYTSVLCGIDPSPVKSIDYFKEKLK